MSNPPELVAFKVGNAFIAGARGKGLIQLLVFPQAKSMGGLWVGGRISLTLSSLEFHPNGMNRAMNAGDLDQVLLLSEIIDIRIAKAAVTDIIEFIAKDGSMMKVRCIGALEFAQRVKAALPVATA